MNPTMIPTFYETKRSITKTFHEAKKERRRNLTNALPKTMMKEEDEEEEKSLTGKSSPPPSLSLSLHDKTTIDNDTAPSV
jgi:hypothetical protein